MIESWEIDYVDHFKSFFRLHIVNTEYFNNEYELINNLSYNFQYLQFLTNVLKKEELHEVIRRLNIKTYLIVSTSIIESILDYYLIKIGEYKTSEWVNHCSVPSDIYIDRGKTLKNIIITQIKTEPFLVKMRFDDVLKKIKDKKLLGDNNDLYISLNKIKKLRNKVHLNNIEADRDHDWNNFKEAEYYECSKCLRKILISNIFSVPREELISTFGFLTTKI
jgi:hypothetical protein